MREPLSPSFTFQPSPFNAFLLMALRTIQLFPHVVVPQNLLDPRIRVKESVLVPDIYGTSCRTDNVRRGKRLCRRMPCLHRAPAASARLKRNVSLYLSRPAPPPLR